MHVQIGQCYAWWFSVSQFEFCTATKGVRGGVLSSPMGSLGFLTDLFLPAALWPWSRCSL